MSVSGAARIEELKRQPIVDVISPLIESPSDTTLSKVLALLRDREIYEAFLPETNRCGMISERELLRATNFETSKISSAITYVPTLPKDTSVSEAARLMADYRIRAAPVSDGRKIMGQVNCTALLKELNGKIGDDTRVTSIATSSPITIDEAASVSKARELLVRKRIDHLPATSEKRLVGSITSTQIVSLLTNPQRVGSRSMHPQTKAGLDFPVVDVMDREPTTCPPDTTAQRALNLMLSNSKTCILVTQWEELQAIATQRDFMKLLAEVEPEPTIPVFIVGLPDDPFEAEATKAKFNRIIRHLHLAFPDMLEAKSIIKSKHKAGKERGRYEVTVQINTPGNSYSYSENGWELPLVYDVITDRLKRLMTKKQKPQRPREKRKRLEQV